MTAHLVKDSTTYRYKAVCALNSSFRWCLTGTPIQNSLDDFESIVRFLRVAPFEEPGVFKRTISSPYQRNELYAIPRLQKVIQEICLRRTKHSEGVELNIPSRTDHVVDIQLSPDEDALYKFTESQSTLFFQSENSSINALQCILRLRQIACHGVEMLPAALRSELLGLFRASKGQDLGYFQFSLFETNCESCGMAIEGSISPSYNIRLSCPHILCSRCSGDVATRGKGKSKRALLANNKCPLCHPEQVEDVQLENLEARPEEMSNWDGYQPSSKIKHLLDQLYSRDIGIKRYPSILPRSP